MKKTQQQRVIGKLLKDGYITRNECLRNYISRLGAIICDLEHKGWEFEAKYLENKDYCYTVKKCPLKKTVYTLSNGEKIETYEKN